MKTYDEMISEMVNKGFLMKQTFRGYFYCMDG